MPIEIVDLSIKHVCLVHPVALFFGFNLGHRMRKSPVTSHAKRTGADGGIGPEIHRLVSTDRTSWKNEYGSESFPPFFGHSYRIYNICIYICSLLQNPYSNSDEHVQSCSLRRHHLDLGKGQLRLRMASNPAIFGCQSHGFSTSLKPLELHSNQTHTHTYIYMTF
jgi:hypothetical protein